jgi:hypothetical protein
MALFDPAFVAPHDTAEVTFHVNFPLITSKTSKECLAVRFVITEIFDCAVIPIHVWLIGCLTQRLLI